MNQKILKTLFVVYIAAIVWLSVWKHTLIWSWPAGLVVGNLLASAIWAPLAVIHLDRLAIKHHKEHMDLLHKHHREALSAIRNTQARGN